MLLLKHIGSSNFQLVCENFTPVSVNDNTYEGIRDFLQKYFVKKTSYLAERLKFGETKQNEKETLSEFFVKLRAAASTCKFGNTLAERIRDQLILGIQSKEIKHEII